MPCSPFLFFSLFSPFLIEHALLTPLQSDHSCGMHYRRRAEDLEDEDVKLPEPVAVTQKDEKASTKASWDDEEEEVDDKKKVVRAIL